MKLEWSYEFRVKCLNIKEFLAAFPILITLLFNHLNWNSSQLFFSVTTVLWTVIYMVSLYLGPVIYCISSGKYPDAESTLIKIRTLVVAPLCEEIIFRKIILTLLLSAYDTKKAILLALASFSLRKWTFDIHI